MNIRDNRRAGHFVRHFSDNENYGAIVFTDSQDDEHSRQE